MKKLVLLLFIIPVIFACSHDDDEPQTIWKIYSKDSNEHPCGNPPELWGFAVRGHEQVAIDYIKEMNTKEEALFRAGSIDCLRVYYYVKLGE